MAVAFNGHYVAECDGAIFSDSADVVAPQIDQHYMLGPLFRIRQ